MNYTDEPNEILNKIRVLINNLETIEDLNFVREMITKSKRVKGVELKNSLEVGNSVKVVGAESKGITKGIIVKINRTKAVVDVEGHNRHFTIPFEMLIKYKQGA